MAMALTLYLHDSTPILYEHLSLCVCVCVCVVVNAAIPTLEEIMLVWALIGAEHNFTVQKTE